MSGMLVHVVIQLIAGAIGGNVVGAAGGKNVDLGTAINSIGGGVGGQVLSALIPMLAGASGNLDVGALIGQAVGGGVTGAILTAIVGVIKNKMAT
jgi:hypothetical protein